MVRVIEPLKRYTPSKWTSPSLALRAVTSKSGLGVYASSDAVFKGAVFGRDSLELAEDLLYIKPKLVEKILLVIGSFQGETVNNTRDEEPGKILHEYRTAIVEGKPIDGITLEVFNKYSYRWGGDKDSFTYYGSSDSTPLFVRVLAMYCHIYGEAILLKRVTLRSGRSVSMLEILESATNWITNHLKKSRTGFIEYMRANPEGLANQVWKDSVEFYVHKDGQLANHNYPIASIEVQALAYDALVLASEILPSSSKKWLKIADKLRRRTFHAFWMEKEKYFATAIDFNNHGKKRVMETVSANPAALLDSQIFDNLNEGEKEKYISSIVRIIMGDDFLTDAGIRSRALSEAGVVPFWDYHGSFVAWPKETYDISKGLRRQGFPRLAEELDNRLVNVAKATRGYPEFLYVDKKGRVLGASNSTHGHDELMFVDSPLRPETIQAWTVSALLAVTYKSIRRKKPKHMAPSIWQRELEKEIISLMPHVPILKSSKELSARYPAYNYKLADRERP